MSAIAGPGCNVRSDALKPRVSHASVVKQPLMRERLAIVRDTMIVLSMQLVFRTFTMLRRWRVTEF